jgi:hypothetical protein
MTLVQISRFHIDFSAVGAPDLGDCGLRLAAVSVSPSVSEWSIVVKMETVPVGGVSRWNWL